ncbi:MAG: HipA domain-containing protein [Planctomycetes bacterium]|nr:HipA domain-containing protein [Planctomycetota bacterium]
MGDLHVLPSRGKQIFSFEYDSHWLSRASWPAFDPALQLYGGRQYPVQGTGNFGVFLDSSPDRWGRVLMMRREAQLARAENRAERRLLETDYLLGVHDGHRIGALRFRKDGRFLDDQKEFAAPPRTSLRELENACLQLEKEGAEDNPEYGQWLRVLLAPGGSLGGARPKASVVDEDGQLWIAKFPSLRDEEDVGAWEGVVHQLARRAGIEVADAHVRKFASRHHTFLAKRFDRTAGGGRLHFASAMTMVQRNDEDGADEGASYLELAEVLQQVGSDPARDLEQLWRRQVFSICISNTDDHLRNHSFFLNENGWSLTPAYDLNPERNGEGLKLNISETDNTQDLDLALEVSSYYRLKESRALELINEVVEAVKTWSEVASAIGLSKTAQDRMKRAFRIAAER